MGRYKVWLFVKSCGLKHFSIILIVPENINYSIFVVDKRPLPRRWRETSTANRVGRLATRGQGQLSLLRRHLEETTTSNEVRRMNLRNEKGIMIPSLWEDKKSKRSDI